MSALDPHPRSPSMSTTSAADTDLSSEYDIDFSSSDDEAGVFFGTPKAVETKISAALSRNGALATPLVRDRIATFKPRRSSLANRVMRRDSREFVHRKSMLSTPNTAGPSGEKVWEGGFHERTPEDISPVDLSRQEAEQDAVAGPSTPTAPPEEVTLHIDNLRFDAFPSSSDSEDVPNDGTYDSDEEGDKENSALPEEWYGEEGEEGEEEYIPAPPESVPMTIGFRADQFEHDHSQQIDMGNLSILDIDDPEEIPLELGNDTSGGAFLHPLGSSTSSSITSCDSIDSLSRQCALQPPTPPSSARTRPLELDSERKGHANEASREPDHNDDDGEQTNEEVPSQEAAVSPAPIATEVTASTTISPSTTTPKGHSGKAETPDVPVTGDLEDVEPDGECATPGSIVPATEEAMEPTSTVNRRETMDLLAAFRSVAASSSAAAAPMPTFLDDTVDMIEFTPLKPDGGPNDGDASFVSDMDSPMARAPVMIPVFSVQSPPARGTPIRAAEPMLIDDLETFEPGVDSAVDLPNLDDPFGFRLSPFATAPTTTPSKSKLPILSPVKQTPAEAAKAQRVLARSQAAKDHLNELFSSRIGKATRGGESGGSTSAAKPLPRSTQRPQPPSTSRVPFKQAVKLPEESLKVPEADKAKGKAAVAPVKGILKTSKSTQPKPFALSTSQRSVAKPSALPRPTSSLPTPSGLPRPALKRPATTTASQAGPSKLFRMGPKPSARAGEPAHALKRPAFSVSSLSVQPNVPVGGTSSRAALGVPSRPVKDVVSTPSLLSSNGRAGALVNPPLKSPGKGLSPAKPVLGKPYRPPIGMTPTASRTMPTPQRGFSTPSKSFRLGTPSRPAATPQQQRSRMMAALSEERPRGTPIRAEAPPSPPKWINSRMDVEPPVKAEAEVELPVADAVAEARVLAPTASNGSETSATSSDSIQGMSLSPDAEHRNKSSQEASDGNKPSSEQAKESTPPAQRASEQEESPDPLAGSPKEEEAAADEPAQPESQQPSRRSSRARTPRQSHPSPPKKPKATPAESIVPGMTESALKSATTRNTKRNQVYLCTIDRHIVRVPGQRPPSPDAGMRRAAERQSEEQKAGREARAKRRARNSLSEDDEDANDEGPAVERGVLARKAPGDLEEFTTPVRPRPAKRVKHSSGSDSEERSEGGEGGSEGSQEGRGREAGSKNREGAKRVRWDEGLLIIRRGLGQVKHERLPPSKSCVTPKARYPLDEHGNAIDRPTERLKRTTIRVNAVFYDGEEPVHFEYNQPANGKKKKGKK